MKFNVLLKYLFFLLSFVALSCSDPEPVQPSQIKGKWKLLSIQTKYNDANNKLLHEESHSPYLTSYEFKEDKVTIATAMGSFTDSYTINHKNGKSFLSLPVPGTLFTLSSTQTFEIVQLSEGNMTLVHEASNAKFTKDYQTITAAKVVSTYEFQKEI
jgi:hypothetical protein